MKRKLLALLFILTLVAGMFTPSFADSSFGTGPSISGEASILMDASTGSILCGKNVDQKMFPASLTKIMTAILAIENLSLDARVLIDDEVVNTTTSWRDVKLSVGDTVTVEQAIYLLLMESNNAIAVALAKTVAGSTEAFAQMMNERASALSCSDTHFVTPNGLHDENHYTTAHDLAIMTRYALSLPLFVKAAGCDDYDFPKTALTAARNLTNTNWLLNGYDHKLYVKNELRTVAYDGLLCGKTGTTDEAGGCLMGVAKKDDTTLIAITLKAGKSSDGYVDRYVDCIVYFDWGFANYHTVKAMNENALLGQIDVKRGSTLAVDVIAPSDQYVTMKTGQDASDITYSADLFGTLQAPVKAGETAGTYKLYANDSLVGEYPCVTANDVPRGGFLSRFGIPDAKAFRIYRTVSYVFGALALFCLVCLIITIAEGGLRRPHKTFRRRSRY